MPMYSYECKKCNHVFDFLMMDKNEKVSCPRCSATDVEKRITGCNVGGSSRSGSSSRGHGTCPKGGCCPHC